MRHRNRLAWAVVGVVGLTAGPAAAQQIGGVNTGGGGLGGGTTGGGGLGGGGLGGGGLGGGSMGGGSAAGGSTSSIQSLQIQAAPQITAPTGANTGMLSPSNFLAGYYTNPMSMGLITNTGTGTGMGAGAGGGGAAGGGFGNPLFGASPGGGGSIGFAGNQTTGTGIARQTGAAGLGSLGGQRLGAGGTGLGANATSAVVVPLPVQFSFPTRPAFPTAPVAAPQLQADLSGMLARSAGAISNPAGVQVLTDGGTVVLRGPVASPDEARLVEGMVRLTPGVRAVRNELTFPAAAALPRP
jgi:hypothetical protein